MTDNICTCNEYIKRIQPKLSQHDYLKLSKISNPKAHRFIAECAELCNPKNIFICSDTSEELEYIRRMAIETGEEKPLAIPGHTVHFDERSILCRKEIPSVRP